MTISEHRQITIDGREVAYPPPRPVTLTDAQRAILGAARAAGEITTRFAGEVMHGARGWCREDEGGSRSCCRASTRDGYRALARLERRGLVTHVARGRWEPSAD